MTTSKSIVALYARMKKAAQVAFLSTFIALKPVPAPRPRFSKFGGIYYGKSYDNFRATLQTELAKQQVAPSGEPLVLCMEIVCTKPRTGKLDQPIGDVDNYAKGPMDAINDAKIIWADDKQVAALLVVKRYAEPGEPEGVRLEWATL